jgi:signal transduction histidine kinase
VASRRFLRYGAFVGGVVIAVLPQLYCHNARRELMRTPTATKTRVSRYQIPRGILPQRDTKGFESLVGELSMAMTRAPAAAVDREIESWLGKICQALDLDRSAIYERDAPDQQVRVTHTWLRADFPPFPQNFNPERLLKTLTDWVLAGNSFTFSHPSEIPDDMREERLFVEQYGPKASAVLPMWAGDRVIGAVSFGKFRSAREWSPELLDHLAFAVRLFSSAIERKQSEMALHAAQTNLRIASRRNTMSELVASLAHEINQPLGAILSNLGGVGRLLSRKNTEPAMALAAVNNAIEDTKRAAEIIRRVRFMFTRHAPHKTTLDIEALADEVVQLIAGEAASRKIRVQIEVMASVPRIIGDRVQLQQCVMNLLMNAFDATAEVKSDRREVTIKIGPEKTGWIRVSVCDNGVGIDPSVANRLFEPFVTTKSEGMGMGLFVIRSVVHNHGGKIWATANPDHGTTFSFTLPAAQKRSAKVSKRA